MKITNATLIAVLLGAATGCMHEREQAVGPQGVAIEPAGSTTVQATSLPQVEQSLNNAERAEKLIGESVLTSDHLRGGKIDDFVVDQDSGQILYAIVGIGGIFGLGETRVAVPPVLFTEARKGSVQINVDKHKLNQAPQITRDLDKSPKADFLSNLYGYYGQTPTWERSGGWAGSLSSVRKVSDLEGMKVVSTSQQDLGKVETIVLDVPKGRELFVVLSPSSDLNLGTNYYVFPPGAVRFSADDKTLVADLGREKLSSAPHLAKDDWSELSDPAWGHKVYQYYGQPASFKNGGLEPTGRELSPVKSSR